MRRTFSILRWPRCSDATPPPAPSVQIAGGEALDDLADLPIERYPHSLFLDLIWSLRHTLTAYDAVYVALAEALACPLVTRDAALAQARHRARIEVL